MTGNFIEHLPSGQGHCGELGLSEGSGEPRDSSSASIAACGMLEMAEYLEEDEAACYRRIAGQIIRSVVKDYAVKSGTESNGLVLHSTYSKKSPYNTCTPEGVDECNIWGDYFYMEALTRLWGEWTPYW